MKKIIIALVALVMVACSETPQDKMEKVIKGYLSAEHLTYSPLSFGEKIDTIYTTLEGSAGYKAWMELWEDGRKSFEMAKISGDIGGMDIYLEQMKKANEGIEEYTKSFKPALVGYSIEHAYKVNDRTYTQNFIVDTTFVKVVEAK